MYYSFEKDVELREVKTGGKCCFRGVCALQVCVPPPPCSSGVRGDEQHCGKGQLHHQPISSFRKAPALCKWAGTTPPPALGPQPLPLHPEHQPGPSTVLTYPSSPPARVSLVPPKP